jgi:DNA-binding transcriptional LysR family regulator
MPGAEQISRRIKLRQLNVLMAVSRLGSMAKAAEHLAVSQPVVSKAISDLEGLLRVRLLDRGPYGVEPTPHGRALLRRCAGIFAELRTSVSELEFLSNPDAGELRIGCEETLATGLLPALIERLCRRHPRLTYEIVIADPKTLRERDLRGRNVEVAVMRTEASEHDAAFEIKVLYHDRLRVVAGSKNPWARRRKITLVDLVNERWCLPPADHPVGAMVLEAFRLSGLQPPTRSVTVASAQCTSNLVAKGLFLGVHGRMFLRFNPPSVRLMVLPVELPNSASPVSAVTLTGRTLSPPAELFIKCAQEVTQKLADNEQYGPSQNVGPRRTSAARS